MMKCAVIGPSQSGKTHLISRMSNFPVNDATIIGVEMIPSSITINSVDHDILFFDTSGTVIFLDMINAFTKNIIVFIVIIDNYEANSNFYKQLKVILNGRDKNIIFVNSKNIIDNAKYDLFNIDSHDLVNVNDVSKIKQKILNIHTYQSHNTGHC